MGVVVTESVQDDTGRTVRPSEHVVLNAFTVDVEDYFHVQAFADVIDRSAWDHFATRVEGNMARILDMLADRGVRGTFFVLGWVAKRFPQLVRRIVQDGHEVASHGMSHRLIYTQTPEEFRQETRDSKRVLEDLAQRPVIGYRAATYSITRDSLWALRILCEEGFEYDSSIFPVRHDRYGIPGARCAPHMLEPAPGMRIVEFPLTTKSIFGYRLPVAGGGYFRLFPYWLTRLAFQSVNRRELQPVIFYMHPWEIDADQPRIRASRLSRFRHYLNLGKCEHRLRRLLDDFQFVPARDVLVQAGLLRSCARHVKAEGQ